MKQHGVWTAWECLMDFFSIVNITVWSVVAESSDRTRKVGNQAMEGQLQFKHRFDSVRISSPKTPCYLRVGYHCKLCLYCELVFTKHSVSPYVEFNPPCKSLTLMWRLLLSQLQPASPCEIKGKEHLSYLSPSHPSTLQTSLLPSSSALWI